MNTCKNCRYVKFWDVPNESYTQIACKKVSTIDYITGAELYALCSSVRHADNPDCPNWEQGGIRGFFQRLFKKLNLN